MNTTKSHLSPKGRIKANKSFQPPGRNPGVLIKGIAISIKYSLPSTKSIPCKVSLTNSYFFVQDNQRHKKYPEKNRQETMGYYASLIFVKNICFKGRREFLSRNWNRNRLSNDSIFDANMIHWDKSHKR